MDDTTCSSSQSRETVPLDFSPAWSRPSSDRTATLFEVYSPKDLVNGCAHCTGPKYIYIYTVHPQHLHNHAFKGTWEIPRKMWKYQLSAILTPVELSLFSLGLFSMIKVNIRRLDRDFLHSTVLLFY